MLVIDSREHTQHPETVELLKPLPSCVERLDSADYAFLSIDTSPIGVERCEIGNLLQKLRDGELETQLTRCQEQYMAVYLMVEGVFDSSNGLIAVYKPFSKGYYRNHVYPTTHYEYLIASLVSMDRMGIRIVSTANFDCSMRMVKSIYQYWNKEEHKLFSKIRPIHIPVKMSANPNVPRLLALCNRLPERVAIQLINKYGTIWQILHTPDKELMEVPGFGRVLLTRLKESVGCNS